MRQLQYLNLDLLIESRSENNEYTARIVDSPSGESARQQFRVPLSEVEFENFLLKINQVRTRRVRGGADARGAEVQGFGSRLFETVFSTELRRVLDRSRERAEESGKGLRVRLRLSNCPELADLPWEFMYDTGSRRYLALSEWTPLIRYLDLPAASRAMRVDGSLRILVVVSRPVDLQAVDSDLEWEHLSTALDDLVSDGRISVVRVEDGSLASLQRALRRGEYHVFHFIGHGEYDVDLDDGVLFFEDQSRHSVAVSAPEIGSLLHDHRSLRLAVLNSCEGARSSLKDPLAGTAPSLVHQGIPAVVAMQFEITDVAAIAFARTFYEALADGYPIDAAVAAARKLLRSENPVEWGTPVLYLRSPSGELFDFVDAPTGPPVRAAPDESPTDAAGVGTSATTDPGYVEGLAAYFTHRWQDAAALLVEVAQRHPADQRLQELAEDAQNKHAVDRCLSEATAAEERGAWDAAITALENARRRDPSASVAERIEAAQQQLLISAAKSDLRQLHEHGRWEAVVAAAADLAALLESDVDSAHLVEDARAKLREAAATHAYERAVLLLGEERYAEAEQELEKLVREQPGFRDAEALLIGARIGVRYCDGLAAEADGNWEIAQAAYSDVLTQDPNFRQVRERLDHARHMAPEPEPAPAPEPEPEPPPRSQSQYRRAEMNAALGFVSPPLKPQAPDVDHSLAQIGEEEHVRRILRAPLESNCHVVMTATDRYLRVVVDQPARGRWVRFIGSCQSEHVLSPVAVSLPFRDVSEIVLFQDYVVIGLRGGRRCPLQFQKRAHAAEVARLLDLPSLRLPE